MIEACFRSFCGAQAACLHQLAACQRGLNGLRGKLPQSAGWQPALPSRNGLGSRTREI